MKNTDFAIYLNKYFVSYLPSERGVTATTIDSYRYTFILFLEFMEKEHGVSADKVTISEMTRGRILEFLKWLEQTRNNSVTTRNQRHAAINSFIKYLMYEFPEYINEYQLILSIPFKKAMQPEVSYLKTEGVALYVDQIDTQSKAGLRDYVIIELFYTTGIRVSELINIRVKDVSFDEPRTILIHGKGRKNRFVPLHKDITPAIQLYLAKFGLDQPIKRDEWLFLNHMGKQFTRQGINYIVGKYRDKAREVDASMIPEDMSPHKWRHTTGMELVDSRVDLIYIRDLLGHESVKVTERYAKADASNKRKAIEAVSKEIVPKQEAQWENDNDLKEWLKSLNRSK